MGQIGYNSWIYTFTFIFLLFSFFIIIRYGWIGWPLFFVSRDLFIIFIIIICFTSIICIFIEKRAIRFVLIISFFSILFFFEDNFLFLYIFFECSIFPILIILFLWGNRLERFESMYYLIFFRRLSSYPVIAGLFEGFQENISIIFSRSPIWSIIFLFAFLVKIPVYFLHYWLPKAHVEAPSFGRVILAGLLLKLGGWGFLRFINTCYFNIFCLISLFFLFCGMLLSPFWASLHSDRKGLVAFSSICHINFIGTIIFFDFTLGKVFRVLFFFTHDIISRIIFWFVGEMFHVTQSRQIVFLSSSFFLSIFWGLGFFVFLLSNFGVPPFISFIHELFFLTFLFNVSFFSFVIICIYLLIVCSFCLIFIISLAVRIPVSLDKSKVSRETILFCRTFLLLNFFFFRIIY